MEEKIMYQVSTLQALSMGYSRKVITVGELKTHGVIGLGTFEDVNGEMIMVDGICYQAGEDGTVKEADDGTGVPFASVAKIDEGRVFDIDDISDINGLKELLTVKIEEDFGLNSMHIVRIEGSFNKVCARSESAYRSQHIGLKDVLSMTQKDFSFDDIEGTLVCVYYPDYMDGINAPGWHVHFVSKDRLAGGHVFDLDMKNGSAQLVKINLIKIQMPTEPAFDTYSLKEASASEIKEVEQGKGK